MRTTLLLLLALAIASNMGRAQTSTLPTGNEQPALPYRFQAIEDGWIRHSLSGSYGRSDIAADRQGNLYVAGTMYQQWATFDSSIVVLQPDVYRHQMYLAKYRSDGSLDWIRHTEGSHAFANSVVVDSAGNVFVAGSCVGFTKFGGFVSSGGYQDMYVAKYTANGEVQWVTRTRGTEWAGAGHLAIARDGGVVVAGWFRGRWGTTELGGTRLSSYGEADIFVARLDSSGRVEWVRSGGGAGVDGVGGLAVDADENIYVSGTASDIMKFAGIRSMSVEPKNPFVCRLGRDGQLDWFARFHGSGEGAGVAIAPAGDVYVAGTFSRETSLDDVELTSAGGTDVFLARLDRDGIVVWARSAGGPEDDVVGDLLVDPVARVHVVGGFRDVASFGDSAIESNGEEDMFIATYTVDGDIARVERIGGVYDDRAQSLLVDRVGNHCVVGRFTRATNVLGVDFKGTTFDNTIIWKRPHSIVSPSHRDSIAVVATTDPAIADPRIESPPLAEVSARSVDSEPEHAEDVAGISIRPNPTTGISELEVRMVAEAHVLVSVNDVRGNVVRVVLDHDLAAGVHRFDLGTADLPDGSYYVTIRTPRQQRLQRLVVAR